MSSGINKEVPWDPRFAPSYTPEEMLRMGIFEGKYINDIKGIPVSWKKLPKVLSKKDEPTHHLINTYNIDEIDRVELIMELEETFDISISDREGEDWTTVESVITFITSRVEVESV